MIETLINVWLHRIRNKQAKIIAYTVLVHGNFNAAKKAMHLWTCISVFGLSQFAAELILHDPKK